MRLLLLVLAVAASGCASSELRGLRNDLDRSTPHLQIHEGRSFSFGPMTLGLARLGLSLAGNDESVAMARAILRNARRVQFAHYEVEGAFVASDLTTPDRVLRYVEDGWIPAVTVRENDTAVWLLANDRDGRADEMLFVTLSTDGLTLAKVTGDLTEVARLALREAKLSEPQVDEDSGGLDTEAGAAPEGVVP